MSTRSFLVYVGLVAHGRLERRAEGVVKLLSRFVPGWLARRSFLLVTAWMLGSFALQTVLLGVAMFALLKVADPTTTLGLSFAFLLVAAAGVGTSTVQRTVMPADEERLLVSPVSDRRAHLLSFVSGGALNMLENVLVLPVLLGVTASVVLRDDVSSVALWLAVLVVVAVGAPLAYVVDRCLGLLRVRRVRKGTRGASLAWYALVSGTVFAAGWLAARAVVPWLAAFPRDPDDGNQWVLSFPQHVTGATSWLTPTLTHPSSPPGALAQMAAGEASGMVATTFWVAGVLAVAALLFSTGGAWYRSEWRGGWQGWQRRDLFDLAEALYLGLAALTHRGDALLKVQIYNLCRRREWVVANAFDLVGGAFNWFVVGMALGAAPVLGESPAGAVVFALAAGVFQGTENARGPLGFFKATLSVDAEGRRAGLYRVAGLGVLELYRAKLRLGRIIAAPPLILSLLLIAVLGGLSPGASIVMLAAGAAAFVIGSHVELLPGLISPHFDWEHPDDLEDYYEREQLSDWVSRALSGVWILALALMVLAMGGVLGQGTLVLTTSGAMAAAAVGAGVALNLLSRRVARFADRADFPA